MLTKVKDPKSPNLLSKILPTKTKPPKETLTPDLALTLNPQLFKSKVPKKSKKSKPDKTISMPHPFLTLSPRVSTILSALIRARAQPRFSRAAVSIAMQ